MADSERKFIVTIRAESELSVDDVQHAVISAYPASTDIDAGNTDVELVEVTHEEIGKIVQGQKRMTYKVMDVA